MISALQRKLLRDLWHMKSQAVAIALVIASGVATFVMSLSTAASMFGNLSSYYERCRFADVFVHLKRAPDSLAARLAGIPGVANVQTRTLAEVSLDMPGMADPAQGRLVSIPDHPRPGLNELHLRRGRFPDPFRRDEVLINESFAEAHSLDPGDSFHAVLNGRRQKLAVSGIALSPEYVYAIRPGEILPDEKRYGIIWMCESQIEAAFDLKGAFNDASLTLHRAASEPAVLKAVDELAAPYGGLGAYTREDQLSHRFVSDELAQLRAMATIPPAIFLIVAAFLLNIVITRLVRIQREQIAALKAFGYTNREVAIHYLGFALVIVVAATLLGAGVGGWMGRGMTAMYVKFFRFPNLEYALPPLVIAGAALFALAAATLGVFAAVRQAAVLPPADAMRPEPPAAFRPTVIERLGLQRWFSQESRIILRNLERQPVKAAFSCLGIALAVAVMILGSFSEDLVDFMLDFQYNATQRQDAIITFTEPVQPGGLHEVASIDGIRRAEPFRSVPARIRHGHRHRLITVMGLEHDRHLFRLMDLHGKPVPLPTDGLLISDKLADLLNAKPGGSIELDVLEGSRPMERARIAGLIRDFAGASAYMHKAAVHRLLKEDQVLSGAFAAIKPGMENAAYHELKNVPHVAGVTLKRAALESFRRTMSENLLRMRAFNIAFASIIAFGVVYNAARIALSERGRDLATLRVLGFTRAEISRILLGEIGVIILAGIPLGLLLGYGFAAFAVKALETRTQRFPLVVYADTFAYAVTVVIVAALISALVVRRRLDHLDLVAVLKSRE